MWFYIETLKSTPAAPSSPSHGCHTGPRNSFSYFWGLWYTTQTQGMTPDDAKKPGGIADAGGW